MVPIPKRHYTIVGQIIMLNPPSRNEYIFIYIYIYMGVPVNSTDKVSDGYIRDLVFNLRLHSKLIGVLI